jgi:hypothetical protein
VTDEKFPVVDVARVPDGVQDTRHALYIEERESLPHLQTNSIRVHILNFTLTDLVLDILQDFARVTRRLVVVCVSSRSVGRGSLVRSEVALVDGVRFFTNAVCAIALFNRRRIESPPSAHQ